MPALPLSVFIITLNEADRIGATLAAVRDLSDDIVVVDSGSTDATVRLAREAGARVVHHDWAGYGPQKRFAEGLCRHDWRLNLDADEVVSPALADEIRALFASGPPPPQAYELVIADVFPGETVPRRKAYALTPVRLYHRDAGRYSDSPVHDRVELAPGIAVSRLRGRIHHFSVRSLSHLLAKLEAYSGKQLDEMDTRGRRLAAWRLWTEFPAAFLKAYFARGYWLRGAMGVSVAMIWAFSRWMRVARHLERRGRL